MKRNMKSRLNELRRSGEVQTGSQLAGKFKKLDHQDPFTDLPGRGRIEATPFGPCYLREISFPLDHRHGGMDLSGILSCHGKDLSLPARDRTFESFNPEKSLFLDTETTGLAGGTGSWAFLIGLGWIESSSFLLRQYFLRRPAEERAILNHFAETASRFSTLVTFNGKLFDLPLLHTRQILAGFEKTSPQLHLDLLQCARQLWRKRLPSRSLRSIEESLLGLERYDDIPGEEIPAVYFDYLRRGKTELLKKVFHHNTLDILSMVTLLERVSSLAADRNIEHPAEALSMGCLCLESGRTEEGISFLREAAGSNHSQLAEEAALELALHHKREGRWTDAAAIWLELVNNKAAGAAAYVELAKYYEHRCSRFAEALNLTEKALEFAMEKPELPDSSEFSLKALRHRRSRLIRRSEHLYIQNSTPH